MLFLEIGSPSNQVIRMIGAIVDSGSRAIRGGPDDRSGNRITRQSNGTWTAKLDHPAIQSYRRPAAASSAEAAG